MVTRREAVTRAESLERNPGASRYSRDPRAACILFKERRPTIEADIIIFDRSDVKGGLKVTSVSICISGRKPLDKSRPAGRRRKRPAMIAADKPSHFWISLNFRRTCAPGKLFPSAALSRFPRGLARRCLREQGEHARKCIVALGRK